MSVKISVTIFQQQRGFRGELYTVRLLTCFGGRERGAPDAPCDESPLQAKAERVEEITLKQQAKTATDKIIMLLSSPAASPGRPGAVILRATL